MRKNHCSSSFCTTARVAAPAGAVDHLLVGQHGLARRAPVDERVLLVGQTFFKELQKDPLVPAVILGIAGGDFALPVVGQPHALELGLHVENIFLGPDFADERRARWRRFPPAGQRRPSPSDGARCSRACACSAPPHRRSNNCARGPCECARRDRETSRARSTSAWRDLRRRETPRSSSQIRCHFSSISLGW